MSFAMSGKTKNILWAAGTFTAVTALTAYLSYSVTKVLVKEALDREEPKAIGKAKRVITGNFKETEAYKIAMKLAEKLESTEHERVEITAHDGTKLVGHWFHKEDDKRVIVAMHGWRSTWAWDFGAIADFFFDNKCSVLFAEQRGQGESGGEYMSFGMLERFDVPDWVNWAEKRTGGALPIYLAGISMGAATVLMASGLEQLQGRVNGILADCGFTSAKDIWKHICRDNMHLSYAVRQKVIDDLCRRRIQYGADDYSTLEAMKTNTVPVLFVHGADDTFVPVTMTYENYKACKAPKQLLIVPGADHGMSYFVEKEKYENCVRAFWSKYDGRTGDIT